MRSAVSSPRSLGTIILLGLALVLVGVLVYQAADAARSQQRIAEATLDDYASFAGWQLTQQSKGSILSPAIASLSTQASRVDPERPEKTVVSPTRVSLVKPPAMPVPVVTTHTTAARART